MTAVLAGAAAIGLALGLFGAGGSILTVPLLVVGLGLPEKTAVASALAVVGAIAAFGALLQARRGRVVGRCIVAFGLPGNAGAALLGLASAWVPAGVQMLLFTAVTLAAALQMLRGREQPAGDPGEWRPYRVAGAGFGVGGLTALIGVGGGFLLVPALLRFGRLTLPQAFGTSLALIAANAFAGLVGQLASPARLALDAHVIGPFIGIGILGLISGQAVCERLPRQQLRQGFVLLLLGVAGLVLWRAAAA